MAGRRKVFEKAMKQAANYAWDHQWDEAIIEYKRALKEFPDDLTALTGLGLAYLESHKPDDALEIYQRVGQLVPDDPLTLSQIADVHERLGRLEEAVETCMTIAEIYLQQKEIDKAIRAWLRVTRLSPSYLMAHQKLAATYVREGEVKLAINEYLALARIFQRKGQEEKAIRHCQMALKLDSHNTEARAMLEGLRHGELSEMVSPVLVVAEMERELRPIDIAKQKALSDLAMYLFEDIPPEIPAEDSTVAEGYVAKANGARLQLNRTQINAIISHAIDYHRREMTDEAIDSYLRALEAGVDRLALHFNLGLLYQDKLCLDEAIEHLSLAKNHADYALASHFALGECYRAQDNMEDALDHFIEVLKIVDLQTVQKDRADDLIQRYASLADSYKVREDRESTLAFANSLIEFFSQKGWGDKVREIRQLLNELSEDGVTMSLGEILEVPNYEAALKSLREIQQYVEGNLMLTAVEECYRAIEMAPNYLALHLRLAEIFLRQDRVEDAVAKYTVVADICQVRGDVGQASKVYQRLLKLAPMDVTVRSKLIELLISQGQIDQALDQYMVLADSYYQLARIDKAMEKYEEALHLTPRSSSERAWKVKILHLIGDLHIQRVDWAQATSVYQEIKELSPGDEGVQLQLVDLYFKQGQSERAMQELNELTAYYEAQNEAEKALSILQKAVRQRPYEMSLRARLSQAYIERGMKQEALVELDSLGEMQLEAGMREEAVQTIQLIISLEPKNVRAYKQLLAQIQSEPIV